MGVPQMGDRPLFRKEATDFKDQQNLGQIMPTRPIGFSWLVLPLCLLILMLTFLHSVRDEVRHEAILVNTPRGIGVEFAQKDTKRLNGQWQVLAQRPGVPLAPVELEFVEASPCSHFPACKTYLLKALAAPTLEGVWAPSADATITIVTTRRLTDQLAEMFRGRT